MRRSAYRQDTVDWIRSGAPAQGLCRGNSCLYLKLMNSGSHPLCAILRPANIKLERETLTSALKSADLTAGP